MIARKRKKQNKGRTIRFTFAAAASVMILVTIGLLLLRQPTVSNQNSARNNSSFTGNDPGSGIKPDQVFAEADTGKKTIKVIRREVEIVTESENLGNILEHLDNEELAYFSGLMLTEMLIDEFHNN